MNIEIQITEEGSHTLFLPDKNEHYHSIHGAIQEAECVYINAGLNCFIEMNPNTNPIYIFEMGFGTGLNTFLSLIKAHKSNRQIYYTAIEAYPLEENIWTKLNYDAFAEPEYRDYYSSINVAKWNTDKRLTAKKEDFTAITDNFYLQKIKACIEDTELPKDTYNVVFYDAFAPEIQAELWTEGIFNKMYNSMSKISVLTTYCAKGQVKRNLKQNGFTVKGLEGPKGKREITQAIVLK